LRATVIIGGARSTRIAPANQLLDDATIIQAELDQITAEALS
jgi:hypothetical protein